MSFEVRPEHIDELGHVNNLVYLRWVQDVATAHWTGAARAQDQEDTVWVVVRHEIDFKVPALEGDEVLATTWVEGWRGPTSDRHTEFTRSSDDKVLARARTVWCALDPETHRPKRVTAEMSGPFLKEEGS